MEQSKTIITTILIVPHSKWIEVKIIKLTKKVTIIELRKIFANYAFLKTKFQTMNGPQLISDELERFCRSSGISLVRL